MGWAGALSWWSWSARSVIVNATVTQYTSSGNGVSLPTDYPHGRVTVHGCTVRSSLTGCEVTSRPLDQFSRYSKRMDTFRTAYLCNVSSKKCKWKFPDRNFLCYKFGSLGIWHCLAGWVDLDISKDQSSFIFKFQASPWSRRHCDSSKQQEPLIHWHSVTP